MRRFSFTKLLIISAATMFGAMFGIGKAVAEEGVLTIASVEVNQSFVDQKLDELSADMLRRLKKAGVKRRGTPKSTKNSISVKVPLAQDFDLAEMTLMTLVRNARGIGQDGEFEAYTLEADRELRLLTLRITETYLVEATRNLAERAARVGRCRLAAGSKIEFLSASETTVVLWVGANTELTATFSGCSRSFLSFHEVNTELSQKQLAAGMSVTGYRALPDSEREDRLWLVKSQPLVSNNELMFEPADADSRTVTGPSRVRFNGASTRAFRAWTIKNIGNLFAMVLDGKVVSAPIIREPILGGSIQIFWDLSSDESEHLAAKLDPLNQHIRFEEIEQCEKTRADALRDLSC